MDETLNTTGTTGTTGTTPTTTLDPSQSSLSANFAPYVYDMLGKAQGLASLPYQPYTDDRFAGPSDLQQRGFSAFQNMGAYGPGAFQGGLGSIGSMQDFMSPYMQGVVDVQKQAAQREADINKQKLASKYLTPGGAGAFGGSRYAIETSEADRALNDRLAAIQATGSQAAWDQASRERQFATTQGLQGLNALLQAGGTQQQLNQQPYDFSFQQWQDAQKFPYQNLSFMSSMLQGMPLQAPRYDSGASPFTDAMMGGIGGLALYQSLFGKKP